MKPLRALTGSPTSPTSRVMIEELMRKFVGVGMSSNLGRDTHDIKGQKEVSRLLLGLNCGKQLNSIVLPESATALSAKHDFDLQNGKFLTNSCCDDFWDSKGPSIEVIGNHYEPEDYEHPYFRCCSTKEGYSEWTKNPWKLEVRDVQIKHAVLALKVKSLLDRNDNDAKDDDVDNVTLGSDSVQREFCSNTESDISEVRERINIVQMRLRLEAHKRINTLLL